MRRIVPYQLRQAITSMGGRKMSDLSETQHAQLVEGRRFQVAAFIREMAAPTATPEEEPSWEPVELSVEDLRAMPQLDIESLDDLIMGLRTADMITATSETILGWRDEESAERVAQLEAASTVDGWTEFRSVDGGAGAGDDGGAVQPEAINDHRHPEPADRVSRRRRATPAAGAAKSQG
jgi:hypothetical protein